MRNDTLTTGLFLCRHKNIKKTLAVSFAVAALSFICAATVSCTQFYETLGGTETLTFLVTTGTTVPEEAENASEQADGNGTFLWIDESGSVRREPLSNHCGRHTETSEEQTNAQQTTETQVSGATSITEVTITVARGLVTPVLLYCNDSRNNLRGVNHHPKGLIYPFETELTDKGGFAAHILFRLINESEGDKNETRLFCNRFNWQKFIKSAKKLNNPWECDQDIILNAIADGTFTANILR